MTADDRDDIDGNGEEPTDVAELETTPHTNGNYKVLGELAERRATGVLGHNTASGGRNSGVYGVVDSSDDYSAGVLGNATSSSGAVFGVSGLNSATDPKAAAVRANAGKAARGVDANAGDGPGVHALSGYGAGTHSKTNAADAAAVLAENRALNNTSGTGYGVRALTQATADDSAGVYGRAAAASGRTEGVRGETDSSADGAVGVHGEATVASGRTYGVEGVTRSPSGVAAGVYGHAPNGGRGIFGSSTDGIGILGNSDTNIGVAGTTLDEFAAAVTGDNISSGDGVGTGVKGTTDTKRDLSAGVKGRADATTGAVYGVSGKTNSSATGAAGVHGEPSVASGQTYGVEGVATSPAPGAAGVRGVGTGEAPAVAAEGHVDVSNVGVSAYLSSDQTINNDTQTVVTFDTATRDDFGAYDPSTGIFTVPVDGDYRVETGLFWSDSFSSGRVAHNVEVNGSLTRGINQSFTADDFVARTHSRTVFDLVAGDEIYVEVRQTSGNSKDLLGRDDSQTFLTVVKAG